MPKRTSCTKNVDKIPASGFVAFLFESRMAAELDVRAALCLGTIHAGTFQIVRAMLDVRAKFLFHLGVDLRTLEQSGDAEANPVEEFHSSSGRAASAEAIASTSRFQPSVSSSSRLRPAAVSS